MKAFNLHNYYIGEFTGPEQQDANRLWFRYAQPASLGESNSLVRASLPVNSFPTSPNGENETGVGDLNLFAAYLFNTGDPAVSFGIGPLLTAPTASKDALGTEKWSAGFATVFIDARSSQFHYGYLLTWQASFAGDDNRADVNIGAFQPFGIYQLGKGTYLRSKGIWAYNFETNDYRVPVGLGIGQVFKKGSTAFNAFVEPQFSVADKGPGQPEWQVFFGFSMQFLQ
jgi:hypothetical protein